jgi:hypothetical protein
LDQLARGEKRNDRGDRIFFKPSFIDPDPWRRVRELKRRRAASAEAGAAAGRVR